MSNELIAAVEGLSVRLRIGGGQIVAAEPVPGAADWLALPLPVDVHVHLDKTHTIDRCRVTEPGLFGAIAAMETDLPNWTDDDIRARAERALENAFSHGIKALRSHVDWNTAAEPRAWRVLGDVADEWRGRIAVQLAALAPLDLLGDAEVGPEIAARVAVTGGVLGAFVYRNDDLEEKLDRVFGLAVRHDLLLDFHVDEGVEAEAQGLDVIVGLTARHGMAGHVLCGHACALSVREEKQALGVMDAAALAGVALTVLPTTNLYLQDMAPGRSPRLRGLAPLLELEEAGVSVCFGADNVKDAFYPWGSHDLLEVYRLAVLAGHLDPGAWTDAITTTPAKLMGLESFGIRPGAPADFLLIRATSWADFMCNPRAERHIFRAGRCATWPGRAA